MPERFIAIVVLAGALVMAGLFLENGYVSFLGMACIGLAILYGFVRGPRAYTIEEEEARASARAAGQTSVPRAPLASGPALGVMAILVVGSTVTLLGLWLENGYVSFLGMVAVGLLILFAFARAGRPA